MVHATRSMSSSSGKCQNGDLASKLHDMLAEDEFGMKRAGKAREASEKKAKPGKENVESDPRYVYIKAEGAYDKSPYLRL